ncbi:hypothetical protein EB75_11480 [Mycobacterium sp. ST-F2]|nr:hypothetical protein EB75_11480 [Mycobacterium sp. ST-F2]
MLQSATVAAGATVVVVVVDGAVVDVVGVAEVVGVAAVVAVVVGDAVAEVVGDVGLTGSACTWGVAIAAQAAPRAMNPRVERPNVTARVMESSLVLAASVFPGLWG